MGEMKDEKMNVPSSKILNHRLLFFSILSIVLGHITAATSIFLSEFLSFKFVLLKKNLDSPYGFFIPWER